MSLLDSSAVSPVAGDSILLSVGEAARLLGVCDRTLWQETKNGNIPSVKVRGRRLYRRETLEQYAKSQETCA